MHEQLDGIKAVFVDADDTLWENNLFFLQCIEWLCVTGRRHGMTDKAVLAILDSWERRHIPLHGFGYGCFERSLLATVRQIAWRTAEGSQGHAGLRMRALKWTAFLRRHPIIPMPGVEETLPRLAMHYPVVIVTKGNLEDQMSKVRRSGLLSVVHGAEVVARKSVADYERVLAKYGWAAEDVVMIGNSPASDINSPKRLGIRTIYVPHSKTWHFEVEPIMPGDPATIHIPHFAALRDVLRLPL